MFISYSLLIFLLTTKISAENLEDDLKTSTDSEDVENTTPFDPSLNQADKVEVETKADESEKKIEISNKTSLLNELDRWEAPSEIQKTFYYYVSGFDQDGRPIAILEPGKWNYRLATEGGGKRIKDIYKYIDQGIYRALLLMKERSTPENPVVDAKLIINLEGLTVGHLTHPPTISLVLDLFVRYRKMIEDHLYLLMVVNVNSMAKNIIAIVRPLFSKVVGRVRLYGTNSAKWIPHILRECPKDQIPPKYGGVNKNFKPFRVVG